MPYFRKLERDVDFDGRYHGKDGPIPIRRISDRAMSPFAKGVIAALKQQGFAQHPDQNGAWQDGVYVGAVAVSDRGERVPTSVAYLTDAVRARANLSILTEHLASTMLALYIDHRWMARQFRLPYNFSFATPAGAASLRVRQLVAETCRAIAADLDAGDLEALIAELVGTAASGALTNRAVSDLSDFRIRRARRKLEERPNVHVDLGGVARDVGLSRSHFYEQFRSGVGVAPHMFIDALVLEQAYSLMAHSRQTLDEIARGLGFAAPSSFTRFFKDRVGFPPSTIRRQIGRLG